MRTDECLVEYKYDTHHILMNVFLGESVSYIDE